MSEGVRKTISHASVYGLGTVISNAASIVMLPIYTRFLTPSDYGLLEYLQMLMDVTSIVFGARAFTGVYRMYFETKDELVRKTIMNTALVTDTALHAAGALFLILLARPFAQFVLGDGGYAMYVAVFACGLVTMAMTTVPMYYVRALERPWMFIMISTVKLLMQIGLNIFFVVVLRKGALGVIYSTVITGVVVGGGLSIWHIRRTGWRFSRPICARLLRFGFPLALASVGAFYTTYGDRFFLKYYWGLAAVGLYALGYRFGLALSGLVYGTFNQVWSAQAYKVHGEPDGKVTFQRVFLLIMLALVFVGTALSVLARDILRVMAAPSFYPAANVIPVIIAAYVVRSAGDFAGFGIRMSERTVHFLHASIVSVVVMTAGYAGLIPRWGGMGAAIATFVGMFAEFLWIQYKSNQLVPLHLPWGRVTVSAVLGVIAFGLCELLAPQALVTSIAFRSAGLALFAAVLFFSPIVGRAERDASYRLVRDITQRVRGALPAG